MTVPDFQSLLLPLLKLANDRERVLSDAVELLAHEFNLSDAEQSELLPSGRQSRFGNRVGWASTYLRKAGLLRSVRRGTFEITDLGRTVLASNPATIDLKFLSTHFDEVQRFRGGGTEQEPPASYNVDDGTWTPRPAVQERIGKKIEHWLPDEAKRRRALGVLAFGIESADQDRSDAWNVRETATALRLFAGRLLVCEISQITAKLALIGPVSDELRAALGADAEQDAEFRSIPGGLILTFPTEHLGEHFDSLKDAVDNFIDLAVSKVRQAPDLTDHVPEAVDYIANFIGRELPQPEPNIESTTSEESDVEADDTDDTRQPQVRGRSQIFERGERKIASLMEDIDRGVIALPDLQRPFVWEDTKVRELLDSLFLGFPVGTLVLWLTANEKDARALGADDPVLRATTLVIDGQQRLTSLFAVMRGKEIIGKDHEKRPITIAFRPRDGRFQVADATMRRDPEYLPNITELWTGTRPKSQIRRDLINDLRDKGRAVDQAYEDAFERNLEVAHALENYRFPTIEIRERKSDPNAEEDVSEIFVRINNQGKRLGQADFVLTLLSVFHPTLRDQIEDSARAMSDNTVIAVDTQQLLRATCGVAFNRARMSAVYRFLRGVDPITGETDASARKKMLTQLDQAADDCMEQMCWRDYLLRVNHAGFVSQVLIPSKNAIVNGYAFYIRGCRVGVPRNKLDEIMGRWVFGSLLTARYSGSSETIFEQDLTRLSEVNAESFVGALDDARRSRSRQDGDRGLWRSDVRQAD